MHWLIAAPFIETARDAWLQDFVPGDGHSFRAIPAPYRHNRSRPQTSAGQWRDYLAHGRATWSALGRPVEDRGIITAFPQLAAAIGLRKRLTQRPVPLLAWTFNLGALYGGPKRAVARFALAAVDRFVVHSRREIDAYSRWLELPRERFRFVPLQRPIRPVHHEEDAADPFVLSMGSAQRDYRLFLDVMADLGHPTVIVAGAHALDGLRIPANVKVIHGLGIERCHELAQRARINVVPIANTLTASGQVTLVESMMYARPTIATLTIGTEDYAQHGRTALLVPVGGRQEMRAAIETLWNDGALRERLGKAARGYVAEHLSDLAAGRALGTILDELAAQAIPPIITPRRNAIP